MSNHVTSEHFLSQIDRLIDWPSVAPLMRAISVRVHADVPMGALKMLLLARWYGMSEGALLDACQDRLSFRRFLGLPPTDSRDDARHAEAFQRNVKQAPMEAQNLIHALEAQLLAKGVTIKPGMWAEAQIVPVSSDAVVHDVGLSETTFFPPGEMAKPRPQEMVARGGEIIAESPPHLESACGAQPPATPRWVPLRGIVEWPWGVTTVLGERLNIGRESGFCPFAEELRSYRHMSRRHAELQVCDAGVWVRDLNSHNHTFVNDEQVPPGQAYLVDADSRIRFGPNFVILLKLEHKEPVT